MSDTLQGHPWDRQKDENGKLEPMLWWRRFEIYRLLAPVRTMTLADRTEVPDTDRKFAPTRWYMNAKQWKWDERASAWDKFQAEELEKQIAAEQKRIFNRQYALIHKRVKALNKLAKKLEAYMEDENNIWLPDVKSIGTGPSAERVDLIKFNDALISEYRATFADLADELGHLIKKTKMDVSVTPKEYVGISEDAEGSEP